MENSTPKSFPHGAKRQCFEEGYVIHDEEDDDEDEDIHAQIKFTESGLNH